MRHHAKGKLAKAFEVGFVAVACQPGSVQKLSVPMTPHRLETRRCFACKFFLVRRTCCFISQKVFQCWPISLSPQAAAIALAIASQLEAASIANTHRRTPNSSETHVAISAAAALFCPFRPVQYLCRSHCSQPTWLAPEPLWTAPCRPNSSITTLHIISFIQRHSATAKKRTILCLAVNQ